MRSSSIMKRTVKRLSKRTRPRYPIPLLSSTTKIRRSRIVKPLKVPDGKTHRQVDLKNRSSLDRHLTSVSFHEWTKKRLIASIGTNAGANALPFQGWRHFKEAFAPELIAKAVQRSEIPVRRCLDPFGGSGTTALACQYLGVHPVTVEVNPFLADLIRAKLSSYEIKALEYDLAYVLRRATANPIETNALLPLLPRTLVQPGVNRRWVFDRPIANRIASLLSAIAKLKNPKHRRLFKVLLGGILVEVSNVLVSGKGRRYRKNWTVRRCNPDDVEQLFCAAVIQAILEIRIYGQRKCPSFTVLHGDSRIALRRAPACDIAVFSPPYPNSFDYTDVYNLELWMLGYLRNSQANRKLRRSTLSSHVQIKRKFRKPPSGSRTLDTALAALRGKLSKLWDRNIPAMVGAYFADLIVVLNRVRRLLKARGMAWIVIGDSRYEGVRIRAAKILSELARISGWSVKSVRPFRSMRSSAQQGWRAELSETLLVLQR